MISVIKRDASGQVRARYEGEVLAHTTTSVVIQAQWTSPARDLGYTRFEPGDRFLEYYYSDRWFNIFAISDPAGRHKGWYCNVAEPAQIFKERIEQVDLYLDVWVDAVGTMHVLDEDEFVAATTLSESQRQGAQQGLQTLLQMIAAHQEMFA